MTDIPIAHTASLVRAIIASARAEAQHKEPHTVVEMLTVLDEIEKVLPLDVPNHPGHRAALRGSDAPAGSTAGNQNEEIK